MLIFMFIGIYVDLCFFLNVFIAVYLIIQCQVMQLLLLRILFS